ncbi:nucleotide-diphospho-sugar transferase [Aquirufa sp. 2-AUSEE-184A6]|uniref:Nucleotide-diphospho-sugar transferase n=1 Tax=Aquirufa novilacunae TaxID=3139305 RepID=A0ABW8SUU6_9BACT
MKSPVLLITFNRTYETLKVLERIQKYAPSRVYIFSDGYRNDVEKKVVLELRSLIISKVNWECDLFFKFSDVNLGCKYGPASAINWFFDHELEGIILEDDCLPSLSFFLFCETLLCKYRFDNNIYHIDGTNFCQPVDNMLYHYSRYALIWGWATWKRAWMDYDIEMIDFPNQKKINFLNKIFFTKPEINYWYNKLDIAYENKIDAWDYQWFYTIWKNNGLTIRPNYNMIKNIGFNSNATHTKKSNRIFELMLDNEIDLTLNAPTLKYPNIKIDEETSKNRFNLGKSYFQYFSEKFIYYFYKKFCK